MQPTSEHRRVCFWNLNEISVRIDSQLFVISNQQAFTCLYLTTETLEKSEMCSKCGVVLVFLMLTYFTTFSSVSIVDFEQVNAYCISFVDDRLSIFVKNAFYFCKKRSLTLR